MDLGTLAPMAQFLLGTSAALIESIPGQVHNVEGIHDCPCVGEFFGGGALKAGESLHRDDLNALTPSLGLGGKPGFQDPLGSARNHVQEPGGTAAILEGRHVQNDGDVRVPVCGMAPHVFIHTNDAHAFKPSWITIQQAHPFGQDNRFDSIPG